GRGPPGGLRPAAPAAGTPPARCMVGSALAAGATGPGADRRLPGWLLAAAGPILGAGTDPHRPTAPQQLHLGGKQPEPPAGQELPGTGTAALVPLVLRRQGPQRAGTAAGPALSAGEQQREPGQFRLAAGKHQLHTALRRIDQRRRQYGSTADAAR